MPQPDRGDRCNCEKQVVVALVQGHESSRFRFGFCATKAFSHRWLHPEQAFHREEQDMNKCRYRGENGYG